MYLSDYVNANANSNLKWKSNKMTIHSTHTCVYTVINAIWKKQYFLQIQVSLLTLFRHFSILTPSAPWFAGVSFIEKILCCRHLLNGLWILQFHHLCTKFLKFKSFLKEKLSKKDVFKIHTNWTVWIYLNDFANSVSKTKISMIISMQFDWTRIRI